MASLLAASLQRLRLLTPDLARFASKKSGGGSGRTAGSRTTTPHRRHTTSPTFMSVTMCGWPHAAHGSACDFTTTMGCSIAPEKILGEPQDWGRVERLGAEHDVILPKA